MLRARNCCRGSAASSGVVSVTGTQAPAAPRRSSLTSFRTGRVRPADVRDRGTSRHFSNAKRSDITYAAHGRRFDGPLPLRALAACARTMEKLRAIARTCVVSSGIHVILQKKRSRNMRMRVRGSHTPKIDCSAGPLVFGGVHEMTRSRSADSLSKALISVS